MVSPGVDTHVGTKGCVLVILRPNPHDFHPTYARPIHITISSGWILYVIGLEVKEFLIRERYHIPFPCLYPFHAAIPSH
jgi:hypothetical protein